MTALAVVTCIAALLGRTADAQVMNRPTQVEFVTVVDLLADGRVAADPQTLVMAYSSYLDEFEKLYLKLDAEFVRIREATKSEPGSFLNARETARVVDAEESADQEHSKLIAAFIERVKGAAPAESAAKLDSIRDLLMLHTLAMRSGIYNDISYALHAIPNKEEFDYWQPTPQEEDAQRAGDSDAARAVVFEGKMANLDGRTRAFQNIRKHSKESRLACAKKAEALGVVGKSWDQLNREMQESWSSLRYDEANPAAYQAEMNRMREFQRAMSELHARPEPKHSLDLAKEQLVALRVVEDRLTPSQQSRVYDQWLPGLMGHGFDMPVAGPNGMWLSCPRDFVRELLRIETLTAEQKSSVRTLGRKIIADQRARLRKRLEKCIADEAFGSYDESDQSSFLEQLGELGRAIGSPNWGSPDGEGEFPKGKLADAISDEDAAEFGVVVTERQPREEHRKVQSRQQMNPPEPDRDMEFALFEGLGVPPESQPVVELIVADARARWEEQVRPLLKQCQPKWTDELNHQPDPMAAWRAEIQRAADARRRAFELAQQGDQSLFESLRAAVGDKRSEAALALLAVSPRMAESMPPPWMVTDALRLDVARAIRDAPISATARQALMQEFAPSAEQWALVASRMLKAQLADYDLQQTGERYNVRNGYAQPDAVKRVEEVDEMLARASAAWKSAETEAEQRLTDLVPAEEVDTWKQWVKSMRWPSMYPDLTEMGRAVRRACSQDEALKPTRERADELLRTTQRAINQTGDVALKFHLERKDKTSDPNQWSASRQEETGRQQALLAINAARVRLLAESLRAMLPSEYARLVPGTRMLDRLTRTEPAAAPAATGVPAVATQPVAP